MGTDIFESFVVPSWNINTRDSDTSRLRILSLDDAFV